MHFEDLLEDLGAFGYWQGVIFVLISLADVFGGLSMIIPVFTCATPSWNCHGYEVGNETLSSDGDLETCFLNSSYRCVNITFDDTFTSIVSQAAPGSSGSYNVHNEDMEARDSGQGSQWQLVCSLNYVSDLVITLQMAGLTLGAGCFGQVSDIIGRKKAYFTAFGIMITAGLVSAFAVNWQMYAVCRFLVGAGYGALVVVKWVYPIEFISIRWRTFAGAIGFWEIGIMLLALFAYFIRDWRYLTVVTTASGYLYYMFWILIPESPRWLALHGHEADAGAVLKTIAKRNKTSPPDLSLLHEIVQTDKQEEKTQKQYTYLDLFKNKIYCRRALAVAGIWFVVYTTYYGTTFSLRTLHDNRYLTLFLAGLMEFITTIILIGINKVVGRRISQSVFMCITLVCNIAILSVVATGRDLELKYMILAAALMGITASLGGMNVSGIWTAELFPTVIRNAGMGVGSVAARLGGIFSPQIGFLGSLYNLAPSIINISLCVISLPLIYLLPETRCQPLHDKIESESACMQHAVLDDGVQDQSAINGPIHDVTTILKTAEPNHDMFVAI